MVIVLVGTCTIQYEGRAASKLGEGERLIIIKKDKSILVHRPSGHEPVNWQPRGSKIELTEENGSKVIKATRGSELLKIVFKDVPQVLVFNLADEAEFEMHASEEEMKQAVLLEPRLIEDGFKPIEHERKTGRAGRVDIIGLDRGGNLTVVELKRKAASAEDVKQLHKYVVDLWREFGKKPRAILAAPAATRGAIGLFRSVGIEYKCLSPKTCMETLKKRRGLDAHL